MFETDTFQYTVLHVPSFFQPPDSQIAACQQVMKHAIRDYQRSSYKHGIKHPNALLESGLTAGEAAVITLARDGATNEKVKNPLYFFLALRIDKYFNVNPDDYENAMSHLILGDVSTPNLENRVQVAIKNFLRDIHYKSKGYTARIKTIVHELLEARKEGVV